MVRSRRFKEGQLVLRCILPHHAEVKGIFSPNWKGLYCKEGIIQWFPLLDKYTRKNDKNGHQC